MASVRNHKTGSALPVRKRKNGDVEILLMTSREKGKWLIARDGPAAA